MNYNLLGNTGVLVSELCLGTMTIGGRGYWEVIGTLGTNEATDLLKGFVDAGGNFIDSADGYGFGQSEIFIGEAIKASGIRRQDLVVATKGMLRMTAGINDVGLSRLHLADAINGSLQRLGTDYIDLYQIHGVDHATPIEETLRALEDAVRAGKIRYIGLCNTPAWQIAKANGIAQANKWTTFSTTQNYYSLAGRDIEHEIVPYALDAKMAILPWSPLAGGILSGKFRKGEANPEGSRRTTFDFPPVDVDKTLDIVEVLVQIADEIGASVASVALAALLRQPGITSIIIGAKNVEQLQDNLKASEVKNLLTADHLALIDKHSKPATQYPNWMVERQNTGRMPA